MGDRDLRRDEPAHRAADERGGPGDAQGVDARRRSCARSRGSRSARRASPNGRSRGGRARSTRWPAPTSARDDLEPVLPVAAQPVDEDDGRAVADVDGVDGAPVDRHPALRGAPVRRRSRTRPGASGRSSVRRSAARGSATPDYASGVASSCLAVMRIAIDIDSTLHHYWDVLSRAASAASASTSRTSQQLTWGITRLKPRQVQACARGHALRRGDPRRDALPRRGGDRPRAGTRPATSSTSRATARPTAHDATERGCSEIGLPYDELYCSQDKIARCLRDRHRPARRRQPGQHRAGRRRGPRGRDDRAIPGTATCARTRTSVCAADWAELRRGLAPILEPTRREALIAAHSFRTSRDVPVRSFVARTPAPAAAGTV